MSHKILVINPGSTSTKIGVFEDEKLLFDKTLRHSAEEIAQFPTIADQKDFRKKLVLEALAENHFDMKELSAVCGRGGLMKSIPGGTYQVTTSIVVDLVKGVQGQHASNLGGILAREIADELDIPAYIVDPPGGGRDVPRREILRPSPDPAPQQVPRAEPEGRRQALCQGARHEL